MDKEYVIDIADTIRQQLIGTTPLNVICSWGATHGFFATVFNDMASLVFKVNGRLFKGQVIVAYNEMDYYEIYLRNDEETRLLHDEVYFDQLGDVIDQAIERGTDAEEYAQFCEEERIKLFNGNLN